MPDFAGATAPESRAVSFEARAVREHLRMTVRKQRERRQRNQHLAFARAENVVESQMAFAFLGLEIARGDEATKAAVGRAIGRIGNRLETVDRDQAQADDEFYFSF